jgi:hypothetical protein
VLDHVRAKCPSHDEEPLDGPSIKKAAEEILKTEDFDSCSSDFKNELR